MGLFLLCDSHRQAQAAVVEGIPRLHNLHIPTKRPEDYFAEMVKSDEHMKKVMRLFLSVIYLIFCG